jgi:GNAT superfamily N-acetyltransferase
VRDFDLIGSRVVLRHRVGERDGRPLFSDLIGELVEMADTAVVRQADGSIRQVPIPAVHRIKAVPPGQAEVVALEEVAARGWPAPRTEWLGRWLLRDGDGWTRRANSALLVGAPGRPVAAALAEVARWYRDRGLVPRLAVPLPWFAPADRAAERAGWVAEVDVEVLTARVSAAAAGSPNGSNGSASPNGSGRVVVAAAPTDRWLASYRGGAVPAVGRAILTAPSPVGFASITGPDGAEALAIGRGVVTDRWLGVAAVEVHPDHRRRGLARQVVAALLAWGADAGATHCYLQVEADNPAALALYAGLGFTTHHRYRCRVAAG